MKKFSEIKAAFRSKNIDKPAFVSAMYETHARLFDYQEHLADCNIDAIEIRRDAVVAHFKDPSVLMPCPQGDVRIAPIEAFNFGDYEHEEVQAVRKMVEISGGPKARILDIGANAGFYSLALAHYFPGISGAAFEPIPATYSLLERNLKLNGITSIKGLNLGVSDKPGELLFYTYPSQSGASSITRNLDNEEFVQVRCEVVKLDDYCATNDLHADFIKCDVEGAELFVFKGGLNLLQKDRPMVFCEMLRKWCAKYQYHPNDIITLFAGIGYGCYALRQGSLVLVPEVTETTMETNFIFLDAQKHAAVLSNLNK